MAGPSHSRVKWKWIPHRWGEVGGSGVSGGAKSLKSGSLTGGGEVGGSGWGGRMSQVMGGGDVRGGEGPS